MEKPAVIMNEAAFKILIEALTNRQIQTDDGTTSSEVDQFVQGWKRSKEDKPKTKSRRNYKAEREALKAIMLGNGPMKLNDIFNTMKEKGIWNIEPKQANQRLNTVADDIIEKVGRGLYEMRSQHE